MQEPDLSGPAVWDLPLVAALVRFRFVVLGVVTAASAWAQHGRAVGSTGGEWSMFFVKGSEALFGGTRLPGGFHFYVSYPYIQIGPLALLVTTPLRFIGSDDGLIAATVLMSAVIVGLLASVELVATRAWAAPEHRRLIEQCVLAGGVVVVVGWAEVASAFTHLDDVLVMTGAIGALWAVQQRRPVWLGMAIGLAIAAKPWAVILVPLVLVAGWRDRIRSLVVAGAVALAAWAPFVLVDPKTLKALTPTVDTAPESVMQLFGVASPPGWLRSAQLVVAVVLAAVAVLRGRWHGMLLVGVAARVVLDPGVYPYYTSSLVLAAFVWDVMRRRPWPVGSIVAFVLLDVADVVLDDPTATAVLRLLACVGLIGAVFLAGPAPRSELAGTVRLDDDK